MTTRRSRPLILIDISVPRNIDPEVQRVENVYLYNIDDLNAIVCENVRNRERGLALCNRIIEESASALMEKLDTRKERLYEVGLQFQSNWATHDVVVAGG
jgi:glutamyl-tRNA reductase